MRKLLNTLTILFLAASVQIIRSQTNMGAIAIEDVQPYVVGLFGGYAPKGAIIEKGHIFAFGPASPLGTTQKDIEKYFSKEVTKYGLLRVHHILTSISGSVSFARVIWIPLESVQIFESMIFQEWPYGNYQRHIRGERELVDVYRWKPEFVQAALEAAPENLKEQIRELYKYALETNERSNTRTSATVAPGSTKKGLFMPKKPGSGEQPQQMREQ